jgi:hypothetical protein
MSGRWTLNSPRPSGDGRWDKQAHLDHLHLFVNDEDFVAVEIDTANGPADAVHVDAIVCVGCVE